MFQKNASIMTETWEEQSLEVTNLSMPGINHGCRSRESNNQDVNMSRMSTGFSNVSQLAIEGNNQINNLIKKIEEERMTMIATTQLLVESQNKSVLKSVKDNEEIDMLEAELDEIKHKNRKLERKLKHLTVHSSLPILTSTPRFSPEHHRSLQQIVGNPNHTQHMITLPKQPYQQLTPEEHSQFQHSSGLYSKHSSDDVTSSGENVGHGGSPDMIYPVPANRGPLRVRPVQTNADIVVHSPQYEKLKGGISPMIQSDLYNSYPSVYKTPDVSGVQIGSQPSLYHTPRHVHSQYSSQESVGNLQRGDSLQRSSSHSSNSLNRTPRKVESIYGSYNSMYRTSNEPRLVSQTSPTEMNGYLAPKSYQRSPRGSVDTLHGDVSQSRSIQSSPEHFVTARATSLIRDDSDPHEISSEEFDTQMHTSDPNLAEKFHHIDYESIRDNLVRDKRPNGLKSNTDFKLHTPLRSSTMNTVAVAHVHTPQSDSKVSLTKNNDPGTQHSSDTSPKKNAKTRKIHRRKKPKKGSVRDEEAKSSSSQDASAQDDECSLSEHSHKDMNESFDLAEEELKNLVQKLQDAMPSIHDQETVRRQDTKKPIYSVLVAAEQTRQAMKVFTEYAINAAAGELVPCL